MEKLLWGEVHAAFQRSLYPFPKPNLTELKMGPKRYAYGLSTVITKQDEGVRFQGVHAKNVLIIVDEAPGVNPKIWEAIEGIRSGGNVKVLALGNPTIASGPFHTAFIDNRSGWECFTIDAFDTPNLRGITLEQLVDSSFPEDELDKNICPYLITRRWVREMYFTYGKDHPFWEARVRGQFPKQSPDSLLSLAWLEEASRREIQERTSDEFAAGLDVAGPGEDESSLTIRRGPRVIFHEQTTMSDPRGWVMERLIRFKDVLSTINIDCIGIGWNMYLHVKDTFGDKAVPINVCEAANDPEKFANLKSEFFWGFRMRCEKGDFCGLTDEKTIGQLAGLRYHPTPRGQVEVESKQDSLKRGVKSPDRAESVMLAFASRMLIYGVLDYFKNLKQQQVSIPDPTKKEIPACPQCASVCVVPNNSGWRCNNCGRQWITEKIEISRPLSRYDLLKMKEN